MPTTQATPETDGASDGPTEDLRRLARRGRFVTLVVVGVLVVLLALTAALGGFARRTDEITAAEPGESLTTGAFVLTFVSGTVQHRTSDDSWQVVVTGTGQTTGDTSDTISQGESSGTFVYAQDAGTRQIEVVDGWSYGPTAEEDSHDFLVPGMAPVELRARFKFPAQPQGKLRLVVLDQKFGNPYVFGDEEGWERERTGRDLAIPLTVLPATEY